MCSRFSSDKTRTLIRFECGDTSRRTGTPVSSSRENETTMAGGWVDPSARVVVTVCRTNKTPAFHPLVFSTPDAARTFFFFHWLRGEHPAALSDHSVTLGHISFRTSTQTLAETKERSFFLQLRFLCCQTERESNYIALVFPKLRLYRSKVAFVKRILSFSVITTCSHSCGNFVTNEAIMISRWKNSKISFYLFTWCSIICAVSAFNGEDVEKSWKMENSVKKNLWKICKNYIPV